VIPAAILARYAALADRPHRRFGPGLINDTYLVEADDGPVVMQRLHPLWAATSCEDFEVVTTHLVGKGMRSPLLIRTDADTRCVVDDDDRVWRAQTFLPGLHTHERVTSAAMAESAGALVARFHLAMADLEHDYRFTRGLVHDTAKHIGTLRDALAKYPEHRLFADVRALAEPLLDDAAKLPELTQLPSRHMHGDLKISNVLFDDRERAVALVDLDTIGKMAWPHEMGDALRSWCNPGGEDQGDVRFDLGVFGAGLRGYASEARELPSGEERALLVDGLASIALELSARFVADALNESYFGFDAERFATRGEHNLARARGQWALYESVLAQQQEARSLVGEAFA